MQIRAAAAAQLPGLNAAVGGYDLRRSERPFFMWYDWRNMYTSCLQMHSKALSVGEVQAVIQRCQKPTVIT